MKADHYEKISFYCMHDRDVSITMYKHYNVVSIFRQIFFVSNYYCTFICLISGEATVVECKLYVRSLGSINPDTMVRKEREP